MSGRDASGLSPHYELLKPLANLNETDLTLGTFLTQDAEMLELKKQVKILAPLPDIVLITGPTGTGKEIIARALHGSRSGKFVDLNCGGLNHELLASELFGHVRGSFTGAVEDKVGLFKAAIKGTIFLDEIGELPLTMQSTLLRVLEEGKVRQVGSNVNTNIKNTRIVLATNKCIPDMVEQGLFRADLMYRINTFELKTKPLCHRPDDVKLICDMIEPKFPLGLLDTVHLDGNVRELLHIIRKWQVLGSI
jgi:transcriptional regulator with GAF, ATPase, and Fis domain